MGTSPHTTKESFPGPLPWLFMSHSCLCYSMDFYADSYNRRGEKQMWQVLQG